MASKKENVTGGVVVPDFSLADYATSLKYNFYWFIFLFFFLFYIVVILYSYVNIEKLHIVWDMSILSVVVLTVFSFLFYSYNLVRRSDHQDIFLIFFILFQIIFISIHVTVDSIFSFHSLYLNDIYVFIVWIIIVCFIFSNDIFSEYKNKINRSYFLLKSLLYSATRLGFLFALALVASIMRYIINNSVSFEALSSDLIKAASCGFVIYASLDFLCNIRSNTKNRCIFQFMCIAFISFVVILLDLILNNSLDLYFISLYIWFFFSSFIIYKKLNMYSYFLNILIFFISSVSIAYAFTYGVVHINPQRVMEYVSSVWLLSAVTLAFMIYTYFKSKKSKNVDDADRKQEVDQAVKELFGEGKVYLNSLNDIANIAIINQQYTCFIRSIKKYREMIANEDHYTYILIYLYTAFYWDLYVNEDRKNREFKINLCKNKIESLFPKSFSKYNIWRLYKNNTCIMPYINNMLDFNKLRPEREDKHIALLKNGILVAIVLIFFTNSVGYAFLPFVDSYKNVLNYFASRKHVFFLNLTEAYGIHKVDKGIAVDFINEIQGNVIKYIKYSSREIDSSFQMNSDDLEYIIARLDGITGWAKTVDTDCYGYYSMLYELSKMYTARSRYAKSLFLLSEIQDSQYWAHFSTAMCEKIDLLYKNKKFDRLNSLIATDFEVLFNVPTCRKNVYKYMYSQGKFEDIMSIFEYCKYRNFEFSGLDDVFKAICLYHVGRVDEAITTLREIKYGELTDLYLRSLYNIYKYYITGRSMNVNNGNKLFIALLNYYYYPIKDDFNQIFIRDCSLLLHDYAIFFEQINDKEKYIFYAFSCVLNKNYKIAHESLQKYIDTSKYKAKVYRDERVVALNSILQDHDMPSLIHW